MSNNEFKKKLNSLFKEVGVKKLHTDSKEVFSYSNNTDYISLYKKRNYIVTLLFAISLILQVLSLTLAALVPEPRYFITTFNGHVYEINDPRDTMAEAIAVNKMIEGKRKIVTSISDNDS